MRWDELIQTPKWFGVVFFATINSRRTKLQMMMTDFTLFLRSLQWLMSLTHTAKDGRDSVGTQPHTTKLTPNLVTMANLTMCAMVRNEIPFAVEWIEHHRLQGVDRYLLYDDGSTDDTAWLGHFYDTHGHGELVRVLSANAYRHNGIDMVKRDVARHHKWTQLNALNHCNKRSSGRSSWVIAVDVDEFVYAPQPHQTIRSIIQRKQRERRVRILLVFKSSKTNILAKMNRSRWLYMLNTQANYEPKTLL